VPVRGDAAPSVPIAAVYERLRRVAGRLLDSERPDHTLQPTALVHEAWLRLADYRRAHELDETGFQMLASQVMRHVLTDHARGRAAARRDGGERRPLDLSLPAAAGPALVLEVDEALRALADVDAELAALVELRFFGRHSLPEIATLTGQSLRTVNRRWQLARAWLLDALGAERRP
jgi:RNA polymerase sigma factor (TIGR02999 family)